MSAPSKEEIAEFISVVRDFSDGSLAAHAVAHLDDENERLRADRDKTQNEFARAARTWTAERDRLIAERAECLALLGRAAELFDGLTGPEDEDPVRYWIGEYATLAAKLRGQP